jgi:hypothetical protein
MGGFPYGQTSSVDVCPLADLDGMLDGQEAMIGRLMAAMS